MSRMQPLSTIVARNRPPAGLIILTWFLFIIAPALLLPPLINRILEENEKYYIDEAKLNLTEEINCFISELEPADFLARVIREKLALTGKEQISSKFSQNNFAEFARSFRSGLEAAAGTEISGLIWHDSQMNDWIFDLKPEWQETPSKFALKQIVLSALPFKKRVSFNPDKTRISGFKKQLFGDFLDTPLIEGKMTSLISAKFGGRIFLFYKNFSKESSEQSGEGLLIIIREQSLKPDFLLRKVSSCSFKEQISRSWQNISEEKNRRMLNLRDHTSLVRFYQNDSGMHIISRPEQRFLSLMMFGGRPGLPENTGNIFLRASINSSALLHPLRNYSGLLKFTIQIFILIGTAGFIYVFLFGFSSRADIGQKILAGLSGVSFIPFCLLFLALLFSWQLKLSHNTESARNQLEVSRHLFDAIVRSHRLELKSRFWEMMRKIKSTDGSAGQIQKLLQSESANFPFREFMGISATGEEFEGNFNRETRQIFSNNTISTMRSLLRKLQLGSYHNEHVIKEKRKIAIDNLLGQKWSMGDYIANSSEFLRLALGPDEFLFTGGTISAEKENSGSENISILVRCPNDLLVQDLILHSNKDLATLEKHNNAWKLNGLAFSAGTEAILWQAGNASASDKIFNLPAIPDQNSNISWISKTDNITRLSYLFRLADLDAKVWLWIDMPESVFPVSFWVAAFLFLLSLFVFIRLLLKNTFQEPILLFAEYARQIQSGNYPAKINVAGKDEIGMLGQAFSQMVTGLKHRDELASYVSKEVIQTVQQDSADSLKSGGEIMQASVMFISLKGFAKWTKTASITESVQILNRFLDISNKAAIELDGSLDKVIEDTLMLVFRQKDRTDNYCFRAIQAAVRIQKEMTQLVADIKGLSYSPACKIGFSTGKVLSGKIGSSRGTLDYSVIGNTVNLASRLKAFTESAEFSGIVVCPMTVKTIAREVKFRFIDRVKVKGRTKEFSIFEALEIRENRP